MDWIQLRLKVIRKDISEWDDDTSSIYMYEGKIIQSVDVSTNTIHLVDLGGGIMSYSVVIKTQKDFDKIIEFERVEEF